VIDEHEFRLRLLEVFRTEARGHRQEMKSALRELEKGVDPVHQADALEKVFRAAHTLKGAARAVNKSQIAALCQSLESIFALLKNGHGRLGGGMFGALYDAVDCIEKLEAGNGDEDSAAIVRLNDLRRALQSPGREAADG
jgi:two-component system, chemotaxis family, sensor kinase CheA